MIQNQFQTKTKTKIFKSNNARLYFNSIIGEYFQTHGIIHQSSYVNTPQENRIAKRKNRHLLEVVGGLSYLLPMFLNLFGDAILTATYLINRMPSRVLNFESPCQKLLKCYPTTHIISS